jgi:hypothetical protein
MSFDFPFGRLFGVRQFCCHSKESFYPYGISVCQLMHEQFEDTTEVTRSRASKDRQHNDQQKTIQTDKHDLQSITHKTKDRVART